MANMNALDTSFLVFESISMPQTDYMSITTSKSENVDFKNTMESATKSYDSTSSSKVDESSRVQSDNASIDDQTEKFGNKKEAITLKDSEISDETKEELMGQLVTCVNEIVELIENFTGISDEELENILKDLGMDSIDLLNMENVMQVIFEAEGSENLMNLVTDSEFANVSKEIANTLETTLGNLTKELNVDEENVQEAIRKIVGEMEATIEENPTFQKLFNNVLKGNATNEVESDSLKTNELISNDVEINYKSETSNDNSESEMLKEESKNVFETKNNEKTSKSTAKESIDYSFNQVTENVSEVVDELNEITSARMVINEIVEEIQATIKADTTSVEMQLYPEHLGKVGIQVATEEGVMTAKITVSTREVEEIVRANLDVLKENLNNQGLKVENIEVTIASRSFDDQFNGTKEGNNNGESSKGKHKRALDDEEFDISAKQINEQEELNLMGATVSYEA